MFLRAGNRGSARTRADGRWLSLAVWAVLAVCLAGTVGAAAARRSSVQVQERNRADATIASVAATTTVLLQRHVDFMTILRGTLGTRPDMTNREFARWASATEAFGRYPGGVGYALIQMVPHAKLAEFQRVLLADPPLPSSAASRNVAVVPAGTREVYCLARLSTIPRGAAAIPGGYDMCAGKAAPGFDTAVMAKDGYRLLGDTATMGGTRLDSQTNVFALAAPVYTGDPSAMTVAQRRAALRGVVAGTFDADEIIDQSLGGRRDLRVELLYQPAPALAPLILADGGAAPRDGAAVREFPAGSGGQWAVRISGTPVPPGMSADGQFWTVIGMGLLVSALLAGFLHMLTRGRHRALRLVENKTEELRFQAGHDALTGLPNRAQIMEMLSATLDRGGAISVLFLDLDGFKAVNDTLGHAVGDRLLRAVAGRVTSELREGDRAGRLGGDEFVVLLDGDAYGEGAEVVAGRLVHVLSEPFALEGADARGVRVGVSVGIAAGPPGTAEELLRDADLALYQAKESGKGRYRVFEPGMSSRRQRELELEADLRDALDDGQFVLYYQPILDLRSRRITGAEALLRWRHPVRGMVSPGEFIPVAESSGLIVPIGRWVLREACAQATRWQDAGRPLGIAVNISARQLDAGADFVAEVQAVLADTGLDPAALTIEVTETAVIGDVEDAGLVLEVLRTLGVRVAIDDFGTGYSSLTHLHRLPVDILKIDRSFVGGMTEDAASGTLVRSLVQLGRSLGIETVAEGIEDQVQLDILLDEQCDSGQGYLFNRPLPVEEFDELTDPAAADVA